MLTRPLTPTHRPPARSSRFPRRFAAAAVGLLVAAGPAHAQTRAGAIAGATAGAAVTEQSTDLFLSGAVGYRFNSFMGIGVELTTIALQPDLGPTNELLIPTVRYSDSDGRATVFTTNVRIDLPIASRRIVPFVVGGGGVAQIRERATITITPPMTVIPIGTSLSALGLEPYLLPRPTRVDSSTIYMALTLGGGTTILLNDHLGVDLDARYLGFLGNAGGSLGRFGAGVSYRF